MYDFNTKSIINYNKKSQNNTIYNIFFKYRTRQIKTAETNTKVILILCFDLG